MSITRKIMASVIASALALSATTVANAQSSLSSLSSSSAAPVLPAKSEAEILEEEYEEYFIYIGYNVTDEAEEIAEEYAQRALNGEFQYEAPYWDPADSPRGTATIEDERGVATIQREPTRALYGIIHRIKSSYLPQEETVDVGVSVVTDDELAYIVIFSPDSPA